MYPFVTTGLADGSDVRSIALLRQQRRSLGLPLDGSSNSTSNVGTNRHVSAASAAAPTRGIHPPPSSADASSIASRHGLSASELMSATTLHNRERLMTAELLKQQHQHHLEHREQVATAMALASRNHAFPMPSRTEESQQSPGSRESLILKRAISQLSRHHPLQHHDPSHHHLSLPDDRLHPVSGSAAAAALSMENSRRASLCCAEPDLSQEKDICFGRGQRVQRRKANVAFRKIVATYQETYDQAVSREDKKAVVKKVSRIFSRTGYRFFKESEETTLYGHSKMWIAVSDHDVEYKIGHSFRSGRKQIKQQQQKNNHQRNNQKGGHRGDGGTSGDVPAGGSKDHQKSPSRPMVARENKNNDDDCVLKDDELSDKCICIGDKREKYTGMEAYQYFREFILTFKSIFGTSESIDEKTKIVSSLIEQFKSNKGYRFLKLMSMKKDVEFWVEASTDDIQSEVMFILGGSPPKKPAKEEKVENNNETNDTTGDSIEDNEPKKRQRLLPNSTSSDDMCTRPSAVKRTVTDLEAGANKNEEPKTATISMGSSLTSISGSKNLPVVPSMLSVSSSMKPEDKLPWKKGRKRSLSKVATPTTTQKPTTTTWVQSEIMCKRPGEFEGVDSKTTKINATDPKAEAEIMSAIHRPGPSVPPSLSLPSVLFGNMPSYHGSSQALDSSTSSSGSHSQLSAAADMAAASRAKLLGGPPQHHKIPGFGTPSALSVRSNDTLGKALHAMRSSSNPPSPPSSLLASTAATSLHHRSNGERSLIVEKAKQFEAAKHFEMRAKLLEHLKQQELLYIEKKHKLDMLDLQLQSPDSRM